MGKPAVAGLPRSSATATALPRAAAPSAHDRAPAGQGAEGATPTLPSLDVRVVLFAIADGALKIALSRDHHGPSLPRGAPTPGEALDAAARRIVRQATGVREQYLRQLYTLSVDEPPEWLVIVAYIGLVPAGPQPMPGIDDGWRDVADLPPLAAADRMVVDYALLRLRAKLGYTTIAFHLLPPTFTLSELQGAYETILGRPLDKRNFRRRVIASSILAPTGDKRRDGSHRPALLYRFRAAHDRETYLTPPWSEGN